MTLAQDPRTDTLHWYLESKWDAKRVFASIRRPLINLEEDQITPHALKLLEGYDLQAIGHNSVEYIHTSAEALKLATQTQGDTRGKLCNCEEFI